MDKKRIILLCAMGLLLAAAIALGVAWVIEANEYAGYEADYVDIAEDVLRPDDDIVIIELALPSPTPEQSATPEEVAEPDISRLRPLRAHPLPMRAAMRQSSGYLLILMP